jgi:hypothetical protein
MAKILKLPTNVIYSTVRGVRRYVVAVAVTDAREPALTRWILQYGMLRAAGGRCLKGFNDAAARRGYLA